MCDQTYWETQIPALAENFGVVAVDLAGHGLSGTDRQSWTVDSLGQDADECLDRMIFLGERSLRKATREFAAHYHRERNHQGIEHRLIESDDRPQSTVSAIECVQRLGGMLRFYRRAAA